MLNWTLTNIPRILSVLCFFQMSHNIVQQRFVPCVNLGTGYIISPHIPRQDLAFLLPQLVFKKFSSFHCPLQVASCEWINFLTWVTFHRNKNLYLFFALTRVTFPYITTPTSVYGRFLPSKKCVNVAECSCWYHLKEAYFQSVVHWHLYLYICEFCVFYLSRR
jgi:hypothetical protein